MIGTTLCPDSATRISDAASHILNSDQFTTYSEIQQWQKDMREHVPVPTGPGGVAGVMRMGGNAEYVEGVIINEGAGPVTVTAAPATADKPRSP